MRHPCDTHVKSCVSHGYAMRFQGVQYLGQKTEALALAFDDLGIKSAS